MAEPIADGRLDPWLEDRDWTIRDGALERSWKLDDFAAALSFVNAVGGLAESQGHHPDITLHDYNRVLLRISTHSTGSITENDLELAERIDELQ